MAGADGVLMLREELNLTDEQVEDLKGISEAAREIHTGGQLQMQGMRDQLRDGEITQDQFRELMMAHRTAMMQQRSGFQERIDAILDADQKTQLQSLQRQGGRGRGMMKRGQVPGRGFSQGPAGRAGFGRAMARRGQSQRRFARAVRASNRAQMRRRAFARGFRLGMTL